MPRPKTPTANEKEAAFLVSRADPDFLSSAIKAVSTKKEKAKDKKKFPKPTVQGSDSLRGELGACPKVLKLSPPNLGPNQSGMKHCMALCLLDRFLRANCYSARFMF